MACRLIAHYKNAGIHPIGICDTARHNISKGILIVIRGDFQDVVSSLQLCAGKISGVEVAVHAVCTLFQQEDIDAVLHVDTSNTFNSLHRQTALHNIWRICPSLVTILINIYKDRAELFVNGDISYSQ